MSSEFNQRTFASKMEKSIQSLKKDIATLRTGRANTNMLDTIKVDKIEMPMTCFFYQITESRIDNFYIFYSK